MRKEVYCSLKAHERCKRFHEKKYKKDKSNHVSAIRANYHDRCISAIKLHKNLLSKSTKERYYRNACLTTWFD